MQMIELLLDRFSGAIVFGVAGFVYGALWPKGFDRFGDAMLLACIGGVIGLFIDIVRSVL